MSAALTTVSVKILDKEYQVACPPEEVDALTSAARYLDQKMFGIRESGKVFGLDRIAVMAALNIANEFLANRHSTDNIQSEVGTRISHLDKQITAALREHKQLDL